MGLVWDSDQGRMCPRCRKAMAKCACGEELCAPSGDGIVRVDGRDAGSGGGCGILLQGLGHPAGVVFGVEPGIDGDALVAAPPGEGLDHVVGAVGGEERGREANAERVEAVLGGVGLG